MNRLEREAAADGGDPPELPRDRPPEPITSLRDAIVDGFSVGHADGVSDADEVWGDADCAGAREAEVLAELDQRARDVARACASSRGVPARYRDDWCREYVRGACAAHGEIAMRRREVN